MADELYQEFFLSLCELKDDRLIQAKEGGFLEVYCISIIHHIWSNRGRVKRYSNGRTSPLFECNDITISDPSIPVNKRYLKKTQSEGFIDFELEDDSDQYANEIDHAYSEVMEQVERDLSGDDRNEWFRASVFLQLNTNFKNAREFSIKSKIPYNVVREANQLYKQKLKDKCRMP